MRKPRAYPNKVLEEEAQETLESRLTHLCEMKMELREKSKAFKESTKNLRESIKSMENIIISEVTELKHTVVVGDIKAEYVPSVVIKLKKEQNND